MPRVNKKTKSKKTSKPSKPSKPAKPLKLSKPSSKPPKPSKPSHLHDRKPFVDPNAPIGGQQPVPSSGHGLVRTLKDMSSSEIRALEKLYGCKVIRP